MSDPVVPPLLRQADLDRVETFLPDSAVLALDPATGEAVNLTLRGISRAHLMVLHGITSLTGLSDSLAAQPTLGELAGKLVGFLFEADFHFYRLEFGDALASAIEVIHPNDRGPMPDHRFWRFQGTLGRPTADTPLVVSEIAPAHLEGRQWLSTGVGRIFTSFGGAWAEFSSSSTAEVTLPQILTLLGSDGTINPDYLPEPFPAGHNYQQLVLVDDGAPAPYVPDAAPAAEARSGASYTLTAADSGRYLIKSHTAPHAMGVTAMAGGVYAYLPDQAVIVFNGSPSHNLTLGAAGGATLLYPPGREVLTPYETAVLRRIGSTNIWHIN